MLKPQDRFAQEAGGASMAAAHSAINLMSFVSDTATDGMTDHRRSAIRIEINALRRAANSVEYEMHRLEESIRDAKGGAS